MANGNGKDKKTKKKQVIRQTTIGDLKRSASATLMALGLGRFSPQIKVTLTIDAE